MKTQNDSDCKGNYIDDSSWLIAIYTVVMSFFLVCTIFTSCSHFLFYVFDDQNEGFCSQIVIIFEPKKAFVLMKIKRVVELLAHNFYGQTLKHDINLKNRQYELN